MIHVNGMGWFGAMTAFALDRAGIDFTWDDEDTSVQAWKASTGMVYPSGDPRSEAERETWVRWLLGGDGPLGAQADQYATFVKWCWAHKKPPHGSDSPFAGFPGLPGVKVSAALGIAVNVQRIVETARIRFRDQRLDSVPGGKLVVVARPHSLTTGGLVWGWSRRVQLEFPQNPFTTGSPIALYGKVNRFALTYAYPIGAQPGWWWAGSSLVNEKYPYTRTEGQVQANYDRWQADLATLFPGVRILGSERYFLQGWRPKPHKGDLGQLLYEPGRVYYPALWHSGVRWAPSLIEEVTEWARTRTLSSTS